MRLAGHRQLTYRRGGPRLPAPLLGNALAWHNEAMPTPVVIAQAEETVNPILPSSNEAVWAAVSVLLLFAAIIAVVLVAKFFRRLRESADAAASRAAAAEREVAALRVELREKSA